MVGIAEADEGLGGFGVLFGEVVFEAYVPHHIPQGLVEPGMNETAFYDPPSPDKNSFEQWRDAGGLRTEDRAAQRVAETLASYEPPPLDEAVDEALVEYVDRKKAAMPDMWY